jgi:hypothetical protein
MFDSGDDCPVNRATLEQKGIVPFLPGNPEGNSQ